MKTHSLVKAIQHLQLSGADDAILLQILLLFHSIQEKITNQFRDHCGDYENTTLQLLKQKLVVVASRIFWNSCALPMSSGRDPAHERIVEIAKGVIMSQFPQSAEVALTHPIMFCLIDDLGLSTRIVNCLKREQWGGIVYVGNLVMYGEWELLRKIPGLAQKSVDRIKEVLATRGLTLNMKLEASWLLFRN